MQHLLIPQTQDERRAGPGVGSCHGHRVLLRRRDSFRVTDVTEDRRGPPAHDHGLGALSSGRLLPQPRARSSQRPLQTALRPPPALHRSTGDRRPPRSVSFTLSTVTPSRGDCSAPRPNYHDPRVVGGVKTS